MLIARNRLREIDRAMRRSAAALLACSTATALTATALTAASEEPAWLRRRQLRPEDESISRKKAGSQGVAGGPCYPGKTECPFSTSCEWDRDSEDGSRAVWKSTSASGARRWRGGRRDDSARTCRKTLIPHRRRVSRAHMCTQGPRAGERPRLGDDRPPYLRNCFSSGRRHRGRRVTRAHL